MRPASTASVQPAAKASTTKVETMATSDSTNEMLVKTMPPGVLKPRSMSGSFLRRIMCDRFIMA